MELCVRVLDWDSDSKPRGEKTACFLSSSGVSGCAFGLGYGVLSLGV